MIDFNENEDEKKYSIYWTRPWRGNKYAKYKNVSQYEDGYMH